MFNSSRIEPGLYNKLLSLSAEEKIEVAINLNDDYEKNKIQSLALDNNLEIRHIYPLLPFVIVKVQVSKIKELLEVFPYSRIFDTAKIYKIL